MTEEEKKKKREEEIEELAPSVVTEKDKKLNTPPNRATYPQSDINAMNRIEEQHQARMDANKAEETKVDESAPVPTFDDEPNAVKADESAPKTSTYVPTSTGDANIISLDDEEEETAPTPAPTPTTTTTPTPTPTSAPAKTGASETSEEKKEPEMPEILREKLTKVTTPAPRPTIPFDPKPTNGVADRETLAQKSAEFTQTSGLNSATAAKLGSSPIDHQRNAIENSNKAIEKSFADLMQDYKDTYDRQVQESRLEEEGKRKAAAWTGATEFATAIANMIGVGSFGSSHQQYQTHSADWMRQADAARKERSAKLDNAKQRLAEMKFRASELQQKGAQALATYDMQKQKMDQANALALQKLRMSAAEKAEANELKRIGLQIKAYDAETNRAYKENNPKGSKKDTSKKGGKKKDPIDSLLGI